MLSKEKVKLGIAPIAWTNDDLPDLGANNTFEQCISEMALAGYKGSEVGNKYPTDPAVLNKALKLRGLTICNAWFSAFLVEKPYEETEKAFIEKINFLKAVGASVIGVSEQSYSIQGPAFMDTPIFEKKYVMNDEEWARLCDGLNKLGKVAKDMGFTMTFHHHMGTVVQTAEETRRLMNNTDPQYVSLLFDSGHFAYCNEDPTAMVTEFIDRIKHVHLKDIRKPVVDQIKAEGKSFMDGVYMGAFTVPGDGDIDFAPIFKVLSDANYEGWMVVEAEQDPAKANPLEYAIKARKYITEQTGL